MAVNRVIILIWVGGDFCGRSARIPFLGPVKYLIDRKCYCLYVNIDFNVKCIPFYEYIDKWT